MNAKVWPRNVLIGTDAIINYCPVVCINEPSSA